MSKAPSNQKQFDELEKKEPVFWGWLIYVCCVLTGDDYYRVARLNDPESNKKIQQLALAMLLPMLIWSVAVYMIMFKVFHAEVLWCAIGAASVGMVLFIVERSIILSSSPGWKTIVARWSIAFCLALIGSFFIDEVIFEKDINKALIEAKTQDLEQKLTQVFESGLEQATKADERYYEQTIKPLMEAVDLAEKRVLQQSKEVNEEAGGQASGVKGSGPATKAKKEVLASRESELKELRADLKDAQKTNQKHVTEFIAHQNDDVRNAEAELTAFKENKNIDDVGLVGRIEAMFGIFTDTILMFIFWVFFTLLFMLVEMLPLIVKGDARKTLYERMNEHMAYSTQFPAVQPYQ